ncbi:MAG: glycosyltransferase [Lachnospiraceae bacterium]|nr:glycosyltransferase [Lachnospiraceae bacterium]
MDQERTLKAEKPKISIVVPVYNVEDYLSSGVESLLRQTYKNLEIILVNDGSKDQSGRICDELGRKDSRVRVIHKANEGVTSTWTKGALASTGEYLCFMDSDDWVDAEMIEDMEAHLSGTKKEIVTCDYVIEGGKRGKQYSWQGLPPGEYTGEQLREKVRYHILGEENRCITFSRCMKLYTRELVIENLKFCHRDVRVGDDSLIVIPAVLDSERIVVLDHKAYYHYRYVENSIVHGYDKNMFHNMQLLKAATSRIVEEKYLPEEKKIMRKRVGQEYILMLLLVLKNEARGNPKGYRANISRICKLPETRQAVKSYPVEMKEVSNRLLYAVLKHPNNLMISILRLAMILYYAGG